MGIILRTSWQFALVGPPIGGALYLVPMVILDLARNHPSASFATLVASIFFFGVFSYLFGIVPAALTGAILGSMRCNMQQRTWGACSAVIGLIAGGLTGCAYDLYKTGIVLPTTAMFLGGPSLISALICSYIFKPETQSQPYSPD